MRRRRRRRGEGEERERERGRKRERGERECVQKCHDSLSLQDGERKYTTGSNTETH